MDTHYQGSEINLTFSPSYTDTHAVIHCPSSLSLSLSFPRPSVGPGHRLGDVSGPVVSSAPSLMEGYGGLDGDEGAGTGVDSAIFQVPCMWVNSLFVWGGASMMGDLT